MNRQALDELKQQIPLLDYLQAQDWRPARRLSRGRWMGLCPLHADHKPSFLVDPSKDLFYCYGCGRGGDVIRFAELYHQVKFSQALALLRQWRGRRAFVAGNGSFLSHAVTPSRRGCGLSAPTRNPFAGTDRAHADRLRARRLSARLADCSWAIRCRLCGKPAWSPPPAMTPTCIASSFRWKAISMAAASQPSAPPHRFLPGAKGGLYCWEQVRALPGSDPGRGPVRLCRVVAGRLSQRHLLAGNPSQCAPVSAAMRRSPNRLSGL